MSSLLHAAVNPYMSNVLLNSAALSVIPHPASTHIDTLNYSVACRFSLSFLPTDYFSVLKINSLSGNLIWTRLLGCTRITETAKG